MPSHVSAIVQFANGESSQSIFSFDSPLKRAGFVEVTGTEGTLAFPDPNTFIGDLKLTRRGADEPEVVQAVGATSTRGSGVLEMARAIRAERPHRAQGETAYHVLDAMVSISESITTGEFVTLSSTATAADPLPEDWDPYTPPHSPDLLIPETLTAFSLYLRRLPCAAGRRAPAVGRGIQPETE